MPRGRPRAKNNTYKGIPLGDPPRDWIVEQKVKSRMYPSGRIPVCDDCGHAVEHHGGDGCQVCQATGHIPVCLRYSGQQFIEEDSVDKSKSTSLEEKIKKSLEDPEFQAAEAETSRETDSDETVVAIKEEPVDGRNYWGVEPYGKGIQFKRYPPPRVLGRIDALVFAAWVVKTLDPGGREFSRVYKEVVGDKK